MKKSVENASFERLNEERKRLSKGKNLEYEELTTQPYLLPGNSLTITDMRRIMKIRIRDIPVRGNFPNASKQTDCPASNCSSKETQIHLYESNCWTKNEENKTLSTTGANYSDIYGRYIQKQFE